LPAPTVYAAAALLVEYGGLAPVVSYAAPAPVQYAPTLLHAAPVQWLVSTTTVTKGGNLQGWPSRCTPETSGWGCCAAAIWSATASLSSRGFDLLAAPSQVRAVCFQHATEPLSTKSSCSQRSGRWFRPFRHGHGICNETWQAYCFSPCGFFFFFQKLCTAL